MPERHLGLHMPHEETLPADLVANLAGLVACHVDLDAVLEVARSARVPHSLASGGEDSPVPEPAGEAGAASSPPAADGSVPRGTQQQQQAVAPDSAADGAAPPAVRIAVARDAAFCFYYHDSLALLRAAGAELVFFSPLCDPGLPPRVAGVYLGGGYPERHCGELAANRSLRAALRSFADAGGVIYAECGGLVYLSQSIQLEEDEAPCPMGGCSGPRMHGSTMVSTAHQLL